MFVFTWYNFFFSIFIFLLLVMCWIRDLWRERVFSGEFFLKNTKFIKLIIILFIFSEVMLFFSFFWAVLNSIYNNDLFLGYEWPSVGLVFFSVFKLPLLNTILLVVSRVYLTFFHEKLFIGELWKLYLDITIFLGGYFFFLQAVEYLTSFFSLRERVQGRCFFIFTGFHGAHVFFWGSFFVFAFSFF